MQGVAIPLEEAQVRVDDLKETCGGSRQIIWDKRLIVDK